MGDVEREKRLAAEAATEFVHDGMAVGLGTGSTVAYLLPALADKRLSIRCVASSPRTEHAAREHGLPVEPFDAIDRLDVSIDGADQVSADGWLIKGGGAAHTREKMVAAASDRFVVVVDSTKPVGALRGPVPVELLAFALPATVRRLQPVTLRGARSPDDGVIGDYQGDVGEPGALADRLSSTPGLVEHGLFPPELVSAVLIGRGDSVERVDGRRR